MHAGATAWLHSGRHEPVQRSGGKARGDWIVPERNRYAAQGCVVRKRADHSGAVVRVRSGREPFEKTFEYFRVAVEQKHVVLAGRAHSCVRSGYKPAIDRILQQEDARVLSWKKAETGVQALVGAPVVHQNQPPVTPSVLPHGSDAALCKRPRVVDRDHDRDPPIHRSANPIVPTATRYAELSRVRDEGWG